MEQTTVSNEVECEFSNALRGNDCVAVRRVLLEEGVTNTKLVDSRRWTPLREASCLGHDGIIEALMKLDKTLDINVRAEGCMPLLIALH